MRLIRGLLFFIALIVATGMHIGATFILPIPLSWTNVLFIVVILLLLITESGLVVWFSFLLHFILELYNASTPFGVVLLASTMGILAAYWLYKHVFTNRSWYVGIALCASALLVFRLVFVAILGILQLAGYAQLQWAKLFEFFGWELLFTSLSVGVLYIILLYWLMGFRKHSRSENKLFRV